MALELILALVIANTQPAPSPLPQPQTTVTVEPIKGKLPFKWRHPKIYMCGRKVRTAAIFCKPVVEVAGSVAQVLIYLVPRR